LTRLLFLAESFHPVLGGGERHLRELSTGLVASGMGATVLTRRGQREWPREEQLDGVRVLRVPPAGPGRTGKYAMLPAALAVLRREASHHDVLVVRGTRVLGLPAVVAARWLGLAVVLQPEINGELDGGVYTWGTPFERGWVGQLIRRLSALRNRFLRDADAFVAMSHKIRSEMLGAGIPREKVSHIPHGVDTGRFRPPEPGEREALRRRCGLPEGRRLVTYTGRLLRGKGLETLVEAFARVASADQGAHLVIVGSGAGQALSCEAEITERVERLGLGDRVTLTGRVENVEDYLKTSDVFVFPSVFEALGISLIEAAACGLACLAARTGGIVDVIEHGRSGLLFEPGDGEELASSLLQLLRDPPHRRALGSRARAVALARFEARGSLERYRALFRELTARRRAWLPWERAPRVGAVPPR
jgi:glycosyltransferase involved in cell wall biosynthesis